MSELQREKFEKLAKQIPLANLNRHLAGYESELINAYWSVWCAAIESAVVELPESHQDEWKELNFSVDEVKKALDDAGVKYVFPETFVRY